jgi:D-alanyl-D-alanine carboxypeptidase/D-alanyl-D-alanine-endopeptidase (penicillin-binding protein 4)
MRRHRLYAFLLLLVSASLAATVWTAEHSERPAAAPRIRAASPEPATPEPCREAVPPPALNAGWKRRLERVIHGRVGVAVGTRGMTIYGHDSAKERIPASNQKLLLSMALFDRFGPRFRIPTSAAAGAVQDGVVLGDLWLIGLGDPSLTARAPGYWGHFDATTLADLARAIEETGIREISGGVIGATGYFAHDFDAPGWQPYVPSRYVQLPTSLALNGNNIGGPIPERSAAGALAKELKEIGVAVRGETGSGTPPAGLSEVATVYSASLRDIVSYMNQTSNNFFAEMLGKLLGAAAFDPPGTIAKGARAVMQWARAHGVSMQARDSSGLSYGNRISSEAVVELLGVAETKPWARALRSGLPRAGQGTLRYRLAGVDVRAKTGSLFNGASALSGWVRSKNTHRWIEFSILDRDVPQSLEDRIVGILAGARIDHRASTC